MAKTGRSTAKGKRGVLARPLDALVFLLPLLLFFEIVSAARQDRLVAFQLLRRFFDLFGHVGIWAPGLAVVVILLATHAASGEKWKVHWREVGFMYVEAAAMALPLIILYRLLAPLSAGAALGPTLLERMAQGIGAGIYEELVFRLTLITAIMILGGNLLKLERGPVAVTAVCVSSILFAAYHHQPVGAEPFSVVPFLFRMLAGAYLAVIFWFRGYGPAAGCHAAYNVVLVILD